MQRAPWWMRRRWRLIALYWLVQAVAVYFVSMPIVWMIFQDGNGLMTMTGSLLFVAVFFALQLLFVLPIRRPGIGGGHVPVLVSLAIGGLLVAGLAGAGVLAVAQFADAYLEEDLEFSGVVFPIVLGGVWLVSTPLLVAFSWRRRRERFLQRVSTGLFLGTVVEAAAIIPLDVLVRRREDCVCATGTYLALAMCGAVGLFVLGPAIFMPLLARRRRRWYAGHCEVCGYDMSGKLDADRCPECGTGWRQAPAEVRTSGSPGSGAG